MTDTIAIALLGSRFMGRAHAQAWHTVSRFFEVPFAPVLHTAVGRDEAALAAFAQRFSIPRTTTDWRAAVTDDAVDLVDVATSNDVHAEQAIAALEAGKHVACEKPLAGTLADARAMAAAAASASGRTFVWFNYRRVPALALAHRLVRSGAIGRIYHVRATYLQDWGGPDTPLVWRFRGEIAGSGAHGDLNAHLVDAVRFITGEEIVSIAGAIARTFITERSLPDDGGAVGTDLGGGASAAATHPSTVDDATLFLATLSGGGVASFEATRLATGEQNRNRLEIHGERGALRFDLTRMGELGYLDAADAGEVRGWRTIEVGRATDGHPYAEAWWPPGHGLGYEHTFTNQAADILTVLGGGEPVVPLADFADAYRTQQVLHAALESARQGCQVELDPI